MDNKKVFEKIFEHLGIPPNPKPVEFASSTLVHSLNMQTKKANPAEELSRRRSGYEDWSDNQRTVFKTICSEAMEKLGYKIPF
jgi:hypothetical protein